MDTWGMSDEDRRATNEDARKIIDNDSVTISREEYEDLLRGHHPNR